MFRKTILALAATATIGAAALAPTSASAYWYGHRSYGGGYHHSHYGYGGGYGYGNRGYRSGGYGYNHFRSYHNYGRRW